MPYPEQPFISLHEAATRILKCTMEQIFSFIKDGHLTAYIRTPSLLPTPQQFRGTSDFDEYVTHSLAMFWGQKLGDLCRITPPVTMNDGWVKCHTIIVSNDYGTAPIVSDITLADSNGRIGPSGEFYWRSGWDFPQKDVMLKTEEAKRFRAKFESEVETHRQQPAKPLRNLVERAVWRVKKKSDKFPQYGDVLIELRHMAKTEDDAGAIIKKVDFKNGISTVGGTKPTTIKTIRNWLTAIKKQDTGAV